MLKQRIITAIVMALVFVGVLFYTPWQVFSVFTGLVFTVAAWEWANLAGLQGQPGRLVYSAVTAVAGLVIAIHSGWFVQAGYLQSVLLGAGLWWALALLWVQSYPSSAVLWGSRPIRLLMGWLVLIPAWLACLFIKNQANGAWLIVFVVLIVAAADIGAYFAGRAFGKHKLAPNVSPGKTWEGVLGGLLANAVVLVLLGVYLATDDWLRLALIVFPAALVSILGDLLESMVKRHRGIKDSSQLLPGHGGVMDRIDGLVAAAPVFLLCMMLLGWTD